MALAWMYLNAAGVRARIRPATAGDATTGSEGRATGPRRLVGLVAPRSAMPIWWSPRGPPPCKAMRLHSGNFSPNIANPLCNSALVASSCSTSQCSARTPSAIRISFLGGRFDWDDRLGWLSGRRRFRRRAAFSRKVRRDHGTVELNRGRLEPTLAPDGACLVFLSRVGELGRTLIDRCERVSLNALQNLVRKRWRSLRDGP